MAYFSSTKRILAGEPIEVFGDGRMARDFTFIDDIVDGAIAVLDRPPSDGEHRILNIGNSRPVGLMEMIATLERELGRTAEKVMRPMQPGDVTTTFADISRIKELTGYAPGTAIEEGLRAFVAERVESPQEARSRPQIWLLREYPLNPLPIGMETEGFLERPRTYRSVARSTKKQ